MSFDNFSSRDSGPDEVTVAYAASVLPLQQTAVSGLDRQHRGGASSSHMPT